jgi:hypothetical protein
MTAYKPWLVDMTEAQFRQWLAYQFQQSSTGVATTGVLAGLGVTATTPSASGSVVVGKGAAMCQPSSQAFPLVEPADETFDVFTANPMQFVNNPRNDVIVLDQVTGLVTNLVGTPNAVPSSGEQSVPVTAVPLARLRHTANATSIPAANIDDLRVYVGLFQGSWQSYTPVLKNSTTGATLASSAGTGRWIRIGKTVIAKGSITSTSATTGGCMVTLPTAGLPANVELNCGSLGLFGTSTPSDQSGIARVSDDKTGIVVVAYTAGVRDAAAGNSVRWSVSYETD